MPLSWLSSPSPELLLKSMGAPSLGQLCRDGQGGARQGFVGVVEEEKDLCKHVMQASTGEPSWGSHVDAAGRD